MYIIYIPSGGTANIGINSFELRTFRIGSRFKKKISTPSGSSELARSTTIDTVRFSSSPTIKNN